MLREFKVTWTSVTINVACVGALATLLRDNYTLQALPIGDLILAAPRDVRYLLLDALKTNVGLRTATSSLLLPWTVRLAFRRFAGLPVAADAVNPDADVAAARVHEMTGGLLGKRPATEGATDVIDVPARRLG